MEQVIQIDLASTRATAYEYFEDIKAAVEYAAVGLRKKYNIEIYDIQAVSQHVIAHASLPDDLPEDFQLGYHLRGISGYLMRYYKEKYEPLVVAKKLFNYTIIPPAAYEDENATLSTNEKLAAVSNFCELLRNSDPNSMEKINKIIRILKGE